MSLPVIVRPEAQIELAEIQIGYEIERPGLVTRFLVAADRSMQLISDWPLMFVEVIPEVRRVLLHKFSDLLDQAYPIQPSCHISPIVSTTASTR